MNQSEPGRESGQSTAEGAAPAGATIPFTRPDRSNPKVSQLLTAAHELFLDQSYETVSTDVIAKAANVSKATLYAHFPSKEALYMAVVSDQCEQLARGIWTSSRGTDDLEATLRIIARNFRAMFATTQAFAFYRSIVAHVSRFPEIGRVFYEVGPKVVQGRIETILRNAHARGDIVTPDPHLAAQQFIQLVSVDIPLNGLIGLELPSDQESEYVLESGLALFLKAYDAKARDDA